MATVDAARNKTAVVLVLGLCGLLGLFLVGPTSQAGMKTREATLTRLRISPLTAEQIQTLAAARPAGVPEHLSLAVEGDSLYVPLQIEFHDTRWRLRFRAPEGVTVYHEFDRFADAFLDVRYASSLDDLQAMPGIAWIDADMETIRVPPPPRPTESTEKPRGAEKIVRGGINGFTGKGVVLAVIDDGIDFRHKDFITTDKDGKPVSRLLYYWDTFARPSADGKPGKPGPYSYPNGTPIGVVYSRDDLTAELRTPTGRIVTGGWHGTPCTGIAAGNGTARTDKRYIGVAPDADIIVVRIGGFGPWNQFLVGPACTWLDEKTGTKPLVVSCSFGHPQQGGRDGTRVAERQLDSLFALGRKARAICIAAGNEAGFGQFRGPHGEAMFRGEESKGVIGWECPGYTAGRVTVYVDTDTPEDVVCTVGEFPVRRYVHPLSKSLVVELGWQSDPTGAKRSGKIELWSKSRKKLHADAYIDTAAWMSGTFLGSALSPRGLLRTPGTMRNAITVGSYDFNAIDDRISPPRMLNSFDGRPMNLGSLSSYSSPGPNRDGEVKPLVVSPGQWFLAPQGGSTLGYNPFNGTSAATPYTAGLVALLLQQKPELTLGEIRALMRKHATSNEVTGRTPNARWGYGRLDYPAYLRILKSVK